MRAVRIATVTAGLVAAGAVFGGVAGVLAGAAWILVEDGSRGLLRDGEILPILGVLGAGLGAMLGPVAAWGMMRHVPLWLAVGGTTLGTLAGGTLGALYAGWGFMLIGGVMGFLMSAAYLNIRVPPDGRRLRGGGASTRLPRSEG